MSPQKNQKNLPPPGGVKTFYIIINKILIKCYFKPHSALFFDETPISGGVLPFWVDGLMILSRSKCDRIKLRRGLSCVSSFMAVPAGFKVSTIFLASLT